MLNQVINLVRNNQLAEAKNLCEQLNRENKKNLDIWLLLAEVYQRTNNLDKAANTYSKAIKLAPQNAHSHTRLAMLYHQQGKFSKALPCYQRSLKLQKNQPSTHFNYAAALQELNKLEDAEAQYQLALSLDSKYTKAYANLGFILRLQGKTAEAIKNYQSALNIEPDIAQIHYNIGLALLDAGLAKESEQHQHRAIELDSTYADAWSGLGAAQFFNGDITSATDSYQQALNLQADNIEILCASARVLSSAGAHDKALKNINHALSIAANNTEANIIKCGILIEQGLLDEALIFGIKTLKDDKNNNEATCLIASIYEKKGDAEQAYQYLLPLLEKKETPAIEVILTFASISKSLGFTAKSINIMEQFIQNAMPVTNDNESKLHFALGKAYDSQENYKQAFSHYQLANQLDKVNFNYKSFRQDIDKQINIFSAGFKNSLATSSVQTIRPIFIIGMPRSGTSLVEQILSSHSEVTGAGELPDINNLALSTQYITSSGITYPDSISQLNTEHINTLSQAYLTVLTNIDDKTKYITDKMPGNFMHLGLIQLMFPDARIIHCVRDPLDTGLSCYFQNFSQNNPWINSLKHIGKVYLEYQRLMNHWKKTLDIPILDIHYEEMVDNQETISRNMIDFCELDWDENCLQFHKNKRFIGTASYQQVRNPIYHNSVKRWKHYQPFINELIKTLNIDK